MGEPETKPRPETLHVQNLWSAPLDDLGDVVESWASLKKKIEETAEDLVGVSKPLRDPEWEGEDAEAGFHYIKKIRKEFDDAVLEAQGIRDILADAHKWLEHYRMELQDIAYRIAPSKNLELNMETGALRIVDTSDNPYQASPPDMLKDQREVQGMIDTVLTRASEVEDLAAWALRQNTGVSWKDYGSNFRQHQINTLDDARNLRAPERQDADDMAPLGPLELTAKEREALGIDPTRWAKMRQLESEAKEAANQRFPEKAKDGGRKNAFLHTYWNARMSREFGPDWTKRFAEAHEGKPGNRPDNEAMDLHNNRVGREIHGELTKPRPPLLDRPYAYNRNELADAVEHAVNSGRTKAIRSDGDVVPSSQVPLHRSGKADDAPPEPQVE